MIGSQPWVKTSLAPGSQVVTDYLKKAGLTEDLDALGFNLVGYGCTTCIGNSGPLPEPISDAIAQGDLVAASVLSGNRNFEGRVNPDVRANYLASPPLVVAYALAGSMNIDITKDPLGTTTRTKPVYPQGHLADLAGDRRPCARVRHRRDVRHPLRRRLQGRRALAGHQGRRRPDLRLGWRPPTCRTRPTSTDMTMEPEPVTDIVEARILALFGDSITTDHISPGRRSSQPRPGGEYLREHQVPVSDFNSYGARRGNHEVMMRGTFANIRIRNQITPGVEGGVTKHFPSGEQMSIYDAAMRYQSREARRWSSSPARNTAPARRATGRPRAPSCWACAR